MRFQELKKKEVINICTCKTLGCPADLEFDCKNGQITALVIPGDSGFCGIWGREGEYLIPWDCIRQIGEDIILVEIREEKCYHKL